MPDLAGIIPFSATDWPGRLVATGRPLPHGRVMLQYKAPKWSGGEYFLQVTTDAAVRVDYVLAVSF